MSTRKDKPIIGPGFPRGVGVDKLSSGRWMLYVWTSTTEKVSVAELDHGFMLDLAIRTHREIIKSDEFKKYTFPYETYRDLCREMP